MNDYDYIYKTLKRDKKRNSVITNSYNTQDFYNYYKKELAKNNKKALDNKTFRQIIKEIHSELRERIADGEIIELPYGVGELLLISTSPKVKLKNNKPVNVFKVNWVETLKLWNNDKEAESNKTLVKYIEKEVFRVVLLKNHCNYKNKEYIKFRTGRRFKNFLKDRVDNNNIIGHRLD